MEMDTSVKVVDITRWVMAHKSGMRSMNRIVTYLGGEVEERVRYLLEELPSESVMVK